jgi:hypothetical protein
MSFIDSEIYQVRLYDWRNGLGILARAGTVLFPLQAIPFLMPTQPPTFVPTSMNLAPQLCIVWMFTPM